MLEATDLEKRLRKVRLGLEHRRGRRDEIDANAHEEAALSLEYDARGELARQAAEIVQAAIEIRRLELRDRVESLVTRGLRAVFGRADLEFFFEPRVHGGIVGIVPALRSKFGDRTIEVGIVEGHGGGIADVISFLLRVVVLSLARPKLTPFLVLDEPFRHVSLEYLRGCAQLLKELNRSAGIQFFLVTHKPDLLDAADVVYRSSNEDGRTIFQLEHDLRDDVYHQRADENARPEKPAPVDLEETKALIGSRKQVSGEAVVTVKAPVARDPLSRIQNQGPYGSGSGTSAWSEKKVKAYRREKARELEREAKGELVDEIQS